MPATVTVPDRSSPAFCEKSMIATPEPVPLAGATFRNDELLELVQGHELLLATTLRGSVPAALETCWNDVGDTEKRHDDGPPQSPLGQVSSKGVQVPAFTSACVDHWNPPFEVALNAYVPAGLVRTSADPEDALEHDGALVAAVESLPAGLPSNETSIEFQPEAFV